MIFIQSFMYLLMLLFGTTNEPDFCISIIQGKVTDSISEALVIGATLKLYEKENFKSSVNSDVYGNYFFNDVIPGTYDILVEHRGYKTTRKYNQIVKPGRTHLIDIKMTKVDKLEDVKMVCMSLIDINNVKGSNVTAEKIKNLPIKSINPANSAAAGIITRKSVVQSIDTCK